ncbi:hypothetical protein BGX27_004875, partial [Mortierella sp. AM989]
LHTMGVEGVFPFLKSVGIEGIEVDIRTIVDPIHVDVLSLFRAYIIATETSIQTRIAKRETRTPSSTATETPVLYQANALDTRLSKLFQKTKDTLHFDGSHTHQKSLARTKRSTQHRSQLAKAEGLIGKVVDLISAVIPPNGAPPIPCTRSRRQKIVKLSKAALRNWKYARGIEPATRANLVANLTNSGWTVCQCFGEADVCISRQIGPTPARHVVVASSDSDFLFHKVQTLLRQDPQRRSTFYRIDIVTDILNRLGITEAEWICAGIISNNDYASSLFGRNFLRSLTLINNANHKYPSSADSHLLLARFPRVSEASRIFDVYYQHAVGIFIKLKETLENGVAAVDNSAIDGRSVAMIEGIELLFRQYKDYHRALRTPAPAPGPVALAPAGPAAPAPVLNVPRPIRPLRTFKNYMPPNKYRDRTFNFSNDGGGHGGDGDGDGDNQPTAKTKDKTPKRKSNKRRAVYNPSSRKARKTDEARESTGTPKSLNPYNA